MGVKTEDEAIRDIVLEYYPEVLKAIAQDRSVYRIFRKALEELAFELRPG